MFREAQVARRCRAAAPLALVAMLGFASASFADTITLTNGNTVEGVVVQRTATAVVVDTAGGRMTLPLSRVRDIEEGVAWDFHLRRADESSRAGNWTSARESYQTARTLMEEHGEPASSEAMALVNRRLEECAAQLEAASASVFSTVLRDVDDLEVAHRYEDALDLLEQTVADSAPGLPTEVLRRRQARVQLAQAHHLSDMVETGRAVESLRQALQLDPSLAEAHNMLGHFLADRSPGNAEAITELERALQLYDASADPAVVTEARHRLAQCLEDAGRNLEASEAYAEVHRADGRTYPRALAEAVDTLMAWATAQPMSGEGVQTLITHLEEAHALDPRRVEPLNLLGDIHRQMGDTQQALTYYQQSLELLHAQPATHLKMGEIYLQISRSDPSQAEQSLRFAVQYDPNLYGAHCALAEIYETRGQLELAMEEVDRAMALSDNFARAYVIRGRIHRAQDDNEGAKADFLAAIERAGNTLEPRLEMGRILAEEDTAAARRYFDDVLALVEEGDLPPDVDPDNVRAQCRVGVGRLMLRERNVEQALAQFQQALELDPLYADAHAALGEAYVTKEEYHSAEQAYQRAIELDPSEPNTYFQLGLLYKNFIIDRDRAVSNFRLYIDHNGTDIEAIRQMLSELGTSL